MTYCALHFVCVTDSIRKEKDIAIGMLMLSKPYPSLWLCEKGIDMTIMTRRILGMRGELIKTGVK